MLWYGIKKKINTLLVLKTNLTYKKKNSRVLKLLNNNSSISLNTCYYYVPYGWDFCILINKINSQCLIYFYSLIYKFYLIENKQFKYDYLYFDKQTSSIFLKKLQRFHFFNLYYKLIKFLFFSFSKVFFIKLKFKGKGYYIYKNKRNSIAPQFGHAHRIYIYSFFIHVKFLSKTSIFLFGLNKTDILKVGYLLKQSKPINIFTGRGVRFNKAIVYKKTGKVSTYR